MTTRPAPALLAAFVLLGAAAPAEAQLGDLLSRGADAVRRQAGKADAATFRPTIEVEDVDLATLQKRLARFGITLPVEADGRVSAKLTLTARLARLTEPGAVTASGTLSSPRLSVTPVAEGGAAAGGAAGTKPFVVRNLSADLELASGVLTLEKLAFEVTAGRGVPAAKIAGSAALPLGGSQTEASASVTVDGLPLNLLWERLGDSLPVAGGTFDGTVKASVPWPERNDPAAYEATATVAATGLTVAGRAVDDLAAGLSLKGGTAKLTRLSAVIAGQPVAGSASVGLTAPHPLAATVTSETFDLAIVPALFPGEPPAWLPADLRGLLALNLSARGTLVPLAADLTAKVRGADLAVNAVPVETVAADLTARLGTGPDGGERVEALAVRSLVLNTDRGSVSGSASADAAANRWSADLTASDLSPRLLEALPPTVRPPAGTVGEVSPGAGAITVRGTAAGALEPFGLTAADVALTGGGLTAFDMPITDLSATLRADEKTVSLTDVRAATDRGTFTGAATLGPADWTAEGRVAEITPAALDLIPPCLRPPIWLIGRSGRAAAAGRARGPREPLGLEVAKAEVSAAGLELLRVPVSTGTGTVTFADGVLTAERVELQTLGGTLAGTVGVDFTAPDLPVTVDATLTGGALAEIPPDLLPAGLSATGGATADVRFDLRFPPPPDPTATDPGDPCAPHRGFEVASAEGSVELTDPAVTLPGDAPAEARTERFASASAGFAVEEDTLKLRDVAVRPVGGRGKLGGSASLGLSDPHRFDATLRWDGLPTDRLVPPLLAAAGFPPDPPAADGAIEEENPPGGGTTLGYASAAGTLKPLSLDTAAGLVKATDVRLPGVGAGPGGRGLTVPDLAAEFDLAPDRLTVKRVDLTVAGAGGETGTLTGSGTLDRTGGGAWSAKVAAERFPLAVAGPPAAAAVFAAGVDLPAGPGDFAGEVDLTAEVSGVGADPAAVRGSFDLSGRDVTVFGVPMGRLDLNAAADGGAIRVERLALVAGPAALAGRAKLSATGDRRWSAAANFTGVDPVLLTARVAPLLPPDFEWPAAVVGTIAGKVTATGALTTGAVEAAAELSADRLRAATADGAFGVAGGLGPIEAAGVSGRATFARSAGGAGVVRVERFAAAVAGGELRITAEVPLGGGEPSVGGGAGDPPTATATLAFEGGRVGELLATALPGRFAKAAGGPPVVGVADVKAAAAWPAGRFAPDTLMAQAKATSDKLTLRRLAGAARPVRVTELKGLAVWAAGEGRADLAARAAGGQVGVRANLTPAPDRPEPGSEAWPVRVTGSAGLVSVDLAAAESLVRGRGAGGGATVALGGTADACVRFDTHPSAGAVRLSKLPPRDPAAGRLPGCVGTPEDLPEPDSPAETGPVVAVRLRGRARLKNVSLGGRPLLTGATLNFTARDAVDWTGQVREGQYGGGTFRLDLAPAAAGGEGGTGAVRVAVTLRNADAARALGPIPWANENVGGRLSLTAAGVAGPRGVRLVGRGTLERGGFLAAAGAGRPGNDYLFDVSRWTLPAEFTFDPRSGEGRVRFDGATAGVGGGSVGGDAVVTFGRGRGVGIDVDADLGGVDAAAVTGGAGGSFAAGRVAGQVTLKGRAVTGLDDLEGQVRLTLLGADPGGLPVVSALRPFVNLRGTTAGRKGEFVARLRDAVLRIERFTLSTANVRLYASGTAALPNGRLDVEVIADTGRRDVASGALLRIAEQAAGPTPVGLALRADRLLRDRVIYLEVGGTVSRPRVRVQAARQAREEALRFFLGELLIPAGAPAGAAAAAGG